MSYISIFIFHASFGMSPAWGEGLGEFWLAFQCLAEPASLSNESSRQAGKQDARATGQKVREGRRK